jgi:hypothetical protein
LVTVNRYAPAASAGAAISSVFVSMRVTAADFPPRLEVLKTPGTTNLTKKSLAAWRYAHP